MIDATLSPRERAIDECRRIARVILEAGALPLTRQEIAARCGLALDTVTKRLTRFGPSAVYVGGICYFAKSDKYPGCWRITTAGEKLAKEGAQAT